KKEAGMGQAFGGAATDALFGAGSGNALTKMTKYATVVFFVLTLSLSLLNASQRLSVRTKNTTVAYFVLTLSLSLLNASQARNKKSNLERTLQSVKEAPAALPPGPIKPVPTNHSVIPTNISGTTPSAPAPANTNQLLITTPAAEKGK